MNQDVVTIKLEFPVIRGEQKIEQITIRRPKGRDLRGLHYTQIAQGQNEQMATLLSRITDPTITENELLDMDMAQLSELGGQVIDFLFQSKTQRVLSE